MKKFLIHGFMAFNTFLIRISGGRFAKEKVFILHTIGRKTGQPRAVPISYFRDGKNFFVLGSNWAQEKHASWYLNLKGNPRATLEVSGKKIPVVARDAEGDEYTRLWQIAIKRSPHYVEYQKKIKRRIPIVVFEPIA